MTAPCLFKALSATGKKTNPNYLPLKFPWKTSLCLARLTRDGLPAIVDLRCEIRNSYDQDLSGHNVVAEIPGIDPTLKAEIVMLGGHLDSWTAATGATSNGGWLALSHLKPSASLKTLGIQPQMHHPHRPLGYRGSGLSGRPLRGGIISATPKYEAETRTGKGSIF